MGYETRCHVRVDDRSGTLREGAESLVLLETDELVIRGEARVKVPRQSIERVTARAGVLTITSPSAIVTLTLGREAAGTWKKKLDTAPRRLIDKLDVKPGARVWLFGIADPDLSAQIDERTPNVLRGTTASRCDVVFTGVDSEAQLDRVDRASGAIVDAGAIWVVHRKGAAGVADTAIFARAKRLGLVYVKVARISDTHTGEKLVWPVASRARKPTTR